MQQVMPFNLGKLKRYNDPIPLFTRYQIESQIESAFQRTVRLPSGGAIVIDHTEALVSIDINSSRATRGSDIEETALNTNLEAANEIARQLRLRDLGGLIVIDFIDMSSNRNQREVENRLRDAVKQDRARVQIGRISRFGLLEMSRQRLRTSLGESHQEVCSRCNGQGTVRGTESLALSILRLIEEEAMKENTDKVLVQLPVDVATFLLNEQRPALSVIEERHNVQAILVPNQHLETPSYEVRRIRQDDNSADDTSYKLAIEVEEPELPRSMQPDQARVEQAAVQRVTRTPPAPPTQANDTPPTAQETSAGLTTFFKRLRTLFIREEDSAESDKQTSKPAAGRRKAEQAESRPQRTARPRAEARNRQGAQQQRQQDQRPNGRADRNQRPERTERAERAEQTERAAAPRPERGGRRPQAAAEQENQATNGPETTAAARDSDSPAPRSRRGRRGGRRRRRTDSSGEQQQQNASNGHADTATQQANAEAAPQRTSTRQESEAAPRRRRTGRPTVPRQAAATETTASQERKEEPAAAKQPSKAMVAVSAPANQQQSEERASERRPARSETATKQQAEQAKDAPAPSQPSMRLVETKENAEKPAPSPAPAAEARPSEPAAPAPAANEQKKPADTKEQPRQAAQSAPPQLEQERPALKQVETIAKPVEEQANRERRNPQGS